MLTEGVASDDDLLVIHLDFSAKQTLVGILPPPWGLGPGPSL